MEDETGKWIALLRGVNVGGANRVPMAELRSLAEGLGWGRVRIYIASGNLVFEAGARDHAENLRAVMVKPSGVDVPALVFLAAQVQAALVSCPWDVQGDRMHVFFCWSLSKVDVNCVIN